MKFEVGDIVRYAPGAGARQDVGVVTQVATFAGDDPLIKVMWRSYAGWNIAGMRREEDLEHHPEADHWLADLSAWRLTS